jgi:undecaprenyl diphosphate synthase
MSDSTPTLDFQPSPDKRPRHVAVIMDGNGRWARQKGQPRVFGHRHGAERVREVVESAGQYGVEVLTLYAFSEENWLRPIEEVGAIMHLLEYYLRRERQALMEKNVRFKVIGDLTRLSPQLRNLLVETISMLDSNDGLTLNVAISYSGRAEIVRAIREIAEKASKGLLTSEEITQDLVSSHLYTGGLPDPDLLIRTSGELRISNFLLWQSAYTEFYFSDVLWPDFDRYEFNRALESFAGRERRFGVTNLPSSRVTSSETKSSLGPC